MSVRDQDKAAAVPLAERLVGLGFTIYATLGTSTALRDRGIRSQAVFSISKGRPNVLDLIEEKSLGWIINTPTSGAEPMLDEVRMRAHAVIRGVPITTTLDGLRAALDGLETLRRMKTVEVCSLQEYHRHAPRLKLPRGEG
jgi:carbamoyl-phosphate synthase large subunit